MVRDTGSINHFTTANQRQPTKSLLGFVTYHSNKILLASLWLQNTPIQLEDILRKQTDKQVVPHLLSVEQTTPISLQVLRKVSLQ